MENKGFERTGEVSIAYINIYNLFELISETHTKSQHMDDHIRSEVHVKVPQIDWHTWMLRNP